MLSAAFSCAFAVGLVFGGWRTTKTWKDVTAGRLLMLSYYLLALGVVCYPWTIATRIDDTLRIVDLSHLISMVAVTATLLVQFRFSTELNVAANELARLRLARVGWALLVLYVIVWLAAHATIPMTEALFSRSYYASPPLIGVLNVLAGLTFVLCGSCASYGLWHVPRSTRAEHIIITGLSMATGATVVYGAAICLQVLINARGGDPQAIHHYMIPLGLGGVAVAVVAALVLTNGLRLSDWVTSWLTRVLARFLPARRVGDPDPDHDPIIDQIHFILFLDDRLLEAFGSDKGLLNDVQGLFIERGQSQEHTKIALQATRVSILDPYNGSQPYDRQIHQMCHYANRNNRFIGDVYRVALALLGPSGLPIDADMPEIEPWHAELAELIRVAIYHRYGYERARAILANKGIVPKVS